MKYASEVIDLLSPYPGREWKMVEILNDVGGGRISKRRERDAIRRGVARVLDGLIENGAVLRRPSRPGVRNMAVYQWKV